jgi:hypothetical protein
MAKAKTDIDSKPVVASKVRKPTKKQLQRCIGEVCFNEDGEIVIDMTKTAKSCPIELRQRIADYYVKGGVVNMKMPLPEPKKH